MLIDDRRFEKLRIILAENGIEVETSELHKVGVDVTKVVLVMEWLRLQEEMAANGA